MFIKNLFMILLILSCASHNKISYKDMALPEVIKPGYKVPDYISDKQWDFDKKVLLHNLRYGYAGRFNIEESILKDAEKEIKKIKRFQNTLELCKKIHEIFEKIPDNHLRVYSQGKSCVEDRSTDEKDLIGRSLSHKKDQTWIVETKKKKNKAILYISIKNFPSHKDTVWNGFLEKVKELHSDTDYVVIDLRGNGGGDDSIGFMLSAYFHKEKDYTKIPIPYLKQIISQTPESQILKINSVEVDLRFNPESQNYLLDRRIELKDNLKKIVNQELEPEKVRILDSIPFDWEFKGYKTPIYILMDKGCGSSCESSIHSFEFNPYVVKVGQHTAGTLHFGNVANLYLPNSLLLIQTPTHANFLRDGRFIEKQGIKPDLEVPNGVDAFDFLLKRLNLF